MRKFIIGLFVALIPTLAMSGIQDGILVRRGLNYGVFAVSINSTTPTCVSNFNTQKIDIGLRFTSTYDVYICSSTFTHIPATPGKGCFPFKSGEKLMSDGYYPGELYLIGAELMPSTTINVIEFYRQEY